MFIGNVPVFAGAASRRKQERRNQKAAIHNSRVLAAASSRRSSRASFQSQNKRKTATKVETSAPKRVSSYTPSYRVDAGVIDYCVVSEDDPHKSSNQSLKELNLPKQKHCEYNVEVIKTSRWIVQRRYKEFEALLVAVKQRRKNLVAAGTIASEDQIPLPELPRKRYFKLRKLDPHFIAKRRLALDQFIRDLLLCPSPISRCPELVAFLTTVSNQSQIVQRASNENDKKRNSTTQKSQKEKEQIGSTIAHKSNLAVSWPSTQGRGEGGDMKKSYLGSSLPVTSHALQSLGAGSGNISTDPTQQKLALALCENQRILFNAYVHVVDFLNAVAKGFILLTFVKTNTEIGVELQQKSSNSTSTEHAVKSTDRNDDIPLKGKAIVNGRLFIFSGLCKVNPLENEADLCGTGALLQVEQQKNGAEIGPVVL